MLKEKRKERKITQLKLSEITGVNVRMIEQYESGAKNINNAKIETLAKLSIGLKCGIKDIIDNKKLIKILEDARL